MVGEGFGFAVLFLLVEVLLLLPSSSSSPATAVGAEDLFAGFLPLEAVGLDALGSTVVGAKCGKSGCGIVRSRVM